MPTVRTRLVAALALLVLGPPLQAEPWRSSNECRICHKWIHKDWALSAHANSFANAPFQEAWQRKGRPRECLSCHAPAPLNETCFASPPKPRDRNLADGVSCITCHSAGPIANGPRGIKRQGLSCGNRVYKTAALCAPCHGSPCQCYSDKLSGGGRQIEQWARGPFRFTAPCQSCHMPERQGRVAELRSPDLPVRTIHAHTCVGSDDAELIRNSVEFALDRKGDELIVSLVNAGAGHCMPAAEGRSLVVRTTFLDDNNLEFDHRTEYLDARNRNRLEPGGSRVFSYLIKDGWRRAKITLLFRHYVDQPERHWILLHHKIFDLDHPYHPVPTGSVADRLRTNRARLLKRWSTPTTVSEWDP